MTLSFSVHLATQFVRCSFTREFGTELSMHDWTSQSWKRHVDRRLLTSEIHKSCHLKIFDAKQLGAESTEESAGFFDKMCVSNVSFSLFEHAERRWWQWQQLQKMQQHNPKLFSFSHVWHCFAVKCLGIVSTNLNGPLYFYSGFLIGILFPDFSLSDSPQ